MPKTLAKVGLKQGFSLTKLVTVVGQTKFALSKREVLAQPQMNISFPIIGR
jgi:hypothetical protein